MWLHRTLQLADGRSHEELECDRAADGIAGEPEEQSACYSADEKRLARPQRDAPRIDVAELGDHLADVVVVTDADAGRAHDDITPSSRIDEAAHRVSRVLCNSQEPRHATGLDHRSKQHRRIGIDDLRGPGPPSHGDELVAGGENSDQRTAADHQPVATERGGDADVDAGDVMSGREHSVPSVHVVAPATHVAANWFRHLDVNDVTAALRVLLFDDSVGAARDGGPGHDADG